MNSLTHGVSFAGSSGAPIAGRLDLPAGPPATYALFAHCFTCTKDFPAASRIAKALVELGIGVLRFDFTGLGSSGGEFADTSFSSNVTDLELAAEFLRRSAAGPRLLIGHSLGGAVVLAGADRIPEATAVVTIGAPYDPRHLLRLFGSAALDDVIRTGVATVDIAGRPFRVGRQLVDDAMAQDPAGTIRNLGKALLVVHAPQDELVGIDNARQIFETARHPKSFLSLGDADHLLTRPSDAAYVAQVVAAWASRYIVGDDEAQPNRSEGSCLGRQCAA